MAEHTYPAVFEKEEEGGYSIYFPDVGGCYTQAENLAEGVENASDALCLMLYELEKGKKKRIPAPTSITDIKNIKKNADDIVMTITCDTQFYKSYFEDKEGADLYERIEERVADAR